MSLSAHFQKSPSLEDADLSWLSVAPRAPVEGKMTKDLRRPAEPIEPRDVLPSKGVTTYLKNVRFNAYKSTRPALLTEINALITAGLRGFEQEFGEDIPEHLKLGLYSKAFERYIEESNLYQPFLRSMKDEYDETVRRQMRKISSYADFDKQLENKDLQHSNQLSETTQELRQRIADLEEKLKTSQSNEKSLNKCVKDLTQENTKLQDTNALLRKELEASKATSNALSTSLARLVDDKNKSDVLESSMMVDLSLCKQRESSLNSEIEKLHQLIAEKEVVFETLVTPERLHVATTELQHTQQENKRISSAHRHLLIRYAALKFMIDEAFRKLDDAKRHVGIPRLEGQKTQGAVQALLNEYNESKAQLQRKEALRLKSPSEKILQLVEDSAYPKIVFECLLDQIEKLQVEKYRLLYGDAEDGEGMEDGLVVDEHGDIAEVIPAGELITCLGLGEDVPCYLRLEGTVRNLHIDRRTTIDLVHEICAAKCAHEVQNAHIVHTAHISAPNLAPCEDPDSTEMEGELVSVGGDRDSPIPSLERPASSFGSPPRSPLSQLRPVSRSYEVNEEGDPVEAVYVPLLPALPCNASMSEFLDCFLKDKVQDSLAAAELAYNIVEALRLFADNSDCRLLSAMMAGEVRPFIWADQNALIEKIRAAVIKENATNSRNADGEWKLTPEKFMKVVRKILVTKSEDDLNLLQNAMTELQNPDSRYVNATLLLYDGEEGERSPFLELIKTQHLTECQAMERTVLACIDQFVDPSAPEISLPKLREALVLADANKTRVEVNQLLARGAGCTVEAVLLQEAKRIPVRVEDFKASLCGGLLKKSPPPGPKKGKK